MSTSSVPSTLSSFKISRNWRPATPDVQRSIFDLQAPYFNWCLPPPLSTRHTFDTKSSTVQTLNISDIGQPKSSIWVPYLLEDLCQPLVSVLQDYAETFASNFPYSRNPVSLIIIPPWPWKLWSAVQKVFPPKAVSKVSATSSPTNKGLADLTEEGSSKFGEYDDEPT